MASQTSIEMTATLALPPITTSPPTLEFTPPPGCIDPEDNWIVSTSCYAYSSPDWLTCHVTEFGPVSAVDSLGSCFATETVANGETSYYTGCPAGYTEVGGGSYVYSSRGHTQAEYITACCPSRYHFHSSIDNNHIVGYVTSVRDGVTAVGEYPPPGCTASYVKELSGQVIPVRGTAYNTYGWEKRQEDASSVAWDYEHDTLFADVVSVSYTVYDGSHTCYGNCYDWYDYYFWGSPPPTIITSADTPTPTATTTPGDVTTTTEPTTTSATDVETTPPVDETSYPETTSEPSTTPAEDVPPITSSNVLEPPPTTTLTGAPTEGSGNSSSPASWSSTSPSPSTSPLPTSAAAIVTPARFVLLGLFASLWVL